MTLKTKLILGLVLLALLDLVVPFPIIGALLIYVIAARPPFFEDWVKRVYGGTATYSE